MPGLSCLCHSIPASARLCTHRSESKHSNIPDPRLVLRRTNRRRGLAWRALGLPLPCPSRALSLRRATRLQPKSGLSMHRSPKISRLRAVRSVVTWLCEFDSVSVLRCLQLFFLVTGTLITRSPQIERGSTRQWYPREQWFLWKRTSKRLPPLPSSRPSLQASLSSKRELSHKVYRWCLLQEPLVPRQLDCRPIFKHDTKGGAVAVVS